MVCYLFEGFFSLVLTKSVAFYTISAIIELVFLRIGYFTSLDMKFLVKVSNDFHR